MTVNVLGFFVFYYTRSVLAKGINQRRIELLTETLFNVWPVTFFNGNDVTGPSIGCPIGSVKMHKQERQPFKANRGQVNIIRLFPRH